MVAGYVKSSRLESARQVFEKMPKKGCVSYTTMIMGLAQDERWTEAVEVFRDMRSAGVITNEVTMVTVISTYTHLGGVWNFRMLHALVMKLQLEGFVLVSTNLLHMYWGCSSLCDARNLFNEMPEKNIVSWIV